VIGALKTWARALKRDVVALWIAARDSRTPIAAKIIAGAVATYALSPIDLIPDFIPVLGYLDDLPIVPLGLWVAVKLIPPPLLIEFRAAAATRSRPVSRLAAAVVIGLWLLVAVLVVAWFWRSLPG